MYSGLSLFRKAYKGRQMNNYIEIMKEKIAEADMVLVGIGEDFGCTEKKIFECDKYHKIFSRIKEENEWIFPYIYAKMAEKEVNEKAYRNLGKMLNGKNYFLVSLRTDDIVYKNNFDLDEERIVAPCGGLRKLQCEENCSDKIYDVPEKIKKAVEEIVMENSEDEGVPEMRCPECGKKMVFNRMGIQKYCETDYLPEWGKYTKWLQGTLNQKLCILELGVGMKYPSVIRWPFEKMTYFNQKATFFRKSYKSKYFQTFLCVKFTH